MLRWSKLLGILAVVLGTTLAAGCIHVPAGMSSSSLPITSTDEYTVLNRVRGSSEAIGFQGIPIIPINKDENGNTKIGGYYSAYRALQNAKRAHDCDGLINITGDNFVFLSPLLISYHKIELEGDAIKFTKGGPNQ